MSEEIDTSEYLPQNMPLVIPSGDPEGSVREVCAECWPNGRSWVWTTFSRLTMPDGDVYGWYATKQVRVKGGRRACLRQARKVGVPVTLLSVVDGEFVTDEVINGPMPSELVRPARTLA